MKEKNKFKKWVKKKKERKQLWRSVHAIQGIICVVLWVC